MKNKACTVSMIPRLKILYLLKKRIYRQPKKSLNVKNRTKLLLCSIIHNPQILKL